MATRFAQMFARTGTAENLLRQFGEPITYYSRTGAAARSIEYAIVERDVELISETGSVVGNAIVIRVLDSDTDGISSTEIDTGGDEVAVPLRVGESTQRLAIVRVLSTENGITRFGVQ